MKPGRLMKILKWWCLKLPKLCLRYSLAIIFCGYLFFELLVWLNPYNPARLEKDGYSQLFYDRDGAVIYSRLAPDEQWRIPVKLAEVSPYFIAAVLAVEDRRFYQHNGVDLMRMTRAVIDNTLACRVVSGASTIDMQLVKMTAKEKRSWSFKLRQLFQAINMNRNYSKKWILEHYLNHIPFGGNIVGIEAASLFYFSKPAKNLTLYEASLLAGLPQRPSLLRPDRFPKKAKKRQQLVLKYMAEVDPKLELPTSLRLYSKNLPLEKNCNKLGFVQKNPLYIQLLSAATAVKVQTSLSSRIQKICESALDYQLSRLPGVDHGAAVVIDNHTSELLATVGTQDFSDKSAGQVNAATSPRSSGSTLKPFIYYQAIQQGRITSDTVLNDAPVFYDDYQPLNYSNKFVGKISARRALVDSLNIPAVKLLYEVGLDKTLDFLRKMSIKSLNKSNDFYGLSLALGGGEVTPLELAKAYHRLFTNRGDVSYLKGSGNLGYKTTGVGQLLTAMLSSKKMFNLPANIAWKTGTSNGFRDAWCVGYSCDFTVCIWLGNKDGRPNSKLIGSDAAAPVLAAVFQKLYKQRVPPQFPTNLLHDVKICKKSGLRPMANCETTIGQGVTGIPLQGCRECQTSRKVSCAEIIYPRPGEYLVVDKFVELKCQSKSEKELVWFFNGKRLKTVSGPFMHKFARGSYVIQSYNPVTQKMSRKVHIKVI